MTEVSKPHKRLDGDDPRIEAIFATHRFVPLNLYDEITKLAEYAVGEIIDEHNGLIEQLEATEKHLRNVLKAYPHPYQVQAARTFLNRTSNPARKPDA